MAFRWPFLFSVHMRFKVELRWGGQAEYSDYTTNKPEQIVNTYNLMGIQIGLGANQICFIRVY